jgi:hypothetical protein
MPRKQSGDKPSSIAARALKTGKATKAEVRKLAGSVLSQDEKKGKRGK